MMAELGEIPDSGRCQRCSRYASTNWTLFEHVLFATRLMELHWVEFGVHFGRLGGLSRSTKRQSIAHDQEAETVSRWRLEVGQLNVDEEGGHRNNIATMVACSCKWRNWNKVKWQWEGQRKDVRTRVKQGLRSVVSDCCLNEGSEQDERYEGMNWSGATCGNVCVW